MQEVFHFINLNVYFIIENQDGFTENRAELDLETDRIYEEPNFALYPRFSRRVAIGELEKYVKKSLTSGELQRQYAVSIIQHCIGME
jgi:hypothetical protein